MSIPKQKVIRNSLDMLLTIDGKGREAKRLVLKRLLTYNSLQIMDIIDNYKKGKSDETVGKS